jgi:creatinine amidohydrolase
VTINLPSVWLQDLTWSDVESYLKESDIVICPVGSTEQHGPAGPLGLDAWIAIAMAEDSAQKAGVVCAPPLWFGDSSHHLGFSGTISLRTETLMAVIQDMSRSLAKHGFRKILFINGHKAANLPALVAATKNLREFELPELFFAVIDPMKMAKKVANEVKEAVEHHCGELEISQCWYKFPHLIKSDRLTDTVVPFAETLSPWFQEDLFSATHEIIDIPWTSAEQREFAPTGSFTPSAKASPEKGKRYHDYMVDQIVAFIKWLRNYRGPIARGR